MEGIDVVGWIKGSIGIGILAFVVWAGARSERFNREYDEKILKKKADAKQKISDEIAAELTLANKALESLPDVDSALNLLRDRYGWRELLETIYVYSVHLDLLREINWDKFVKITLPNLQAANLRRDERKVRDDAINASKPLFSEDIDYLGIDTFVQQPTVETLRDLHSHGYIYVREQFSPERRTFTCALTKRGSAFMVLDGRFCRGDNAKAYLRRAPSMAANKAIASVLYKCVKQIEEAD